MKKYYKIAIKILISGLLIFFVFKKVSINAVLPVFKNINWLYFLSALLVFFVCWLVNSKKWAILLAHLGIKTKVLDLFKINLISMLYAAVMPGGQLTGELVKCYKISKDEKAKGELIFSVIMDRITGFIALIILGTVGIFLTGTKIANQTSIENFFIIIFICSFLVLIFFNDKLAGKVISFFNKPDKEKAGVLKKITELIFLFKGAYLVLIKAIFYGLIFQFLNSFSIYLLSLSLHINLSIIDLLWFNALVSLILFIPITILGLGLREGSYLYFLGQIGVLPGAALSLSLLFSATYLFTGLIGGLFELNLFKSKKLLIYD